MSRGPSLFRNWLFFPRETSGETSHCRGRRQPQYPLPLDGPTVAVRRRIMRHCEICLPIREYSNAKTPSDPQLTERERKRETGMEDTESFGNARCNRLHFRVHIPVPDATSLRDEQYVCVFQSKIVSHMYSECRMFRETCAKIVILYT